MTIEGAGVLLLLAGAGALAAHLGIAVFNDGVRASARTAVATPDGRRATSTQAARLAGPSVGGFGAVMGVLSGLLNPFLLLLPADVVGLRSVRWWMAVLLGIGWGAVATGAVVGLHHVVGEAALSPLPYLGTLADALVWLLPFFPAVGAIEQLGKARGVLVLVVVAATTLAVSWWSAPLWLTWLPLATGLVTYAALLVPEARRSAGERGAPPGGSRFAELHAANVARLRRALPLLMVVGALTGAACQLQVYGGSEVSVFLLADGDATGAAVLDGVRALGYLPLIVMVAAAAGTYGMAGLTLVYPVGYLAPNLPLAAALGAAVIATEVLVLPRLNAMALRHPLVRSTADHLRNGLYAALELGLLGGCLMVAVQAMGAVGFALVGALVMANEALGRPVIRMAAAPAALLVATALLSVIPPDALVTTGALG